MVDIQPEDMNVRILRGRTGVRACQYDKALTDAAEVLKEQEDSPDALIVRAEALYSLGDYEHALVSFYRASRSADTGLLMAEKEAIKVGIRRAEEAIINTVGTAADCFFRSIDTVLKQVPDSFLKASWWELKPLIRAQGSLGPRHLARREDKRCLERMALDKRYLENLVPRIQGLVGEQEDGVVAESQAALDFLEERREFWSQQRPDYS